MMFMGLGAASCSLDSDCPNGTTCNAATGQCEDVSVYCPYGFDISTNTCFNAPQGGSSPSASPIATNCAYGFNISTGQCYSAPQSSAPSVSSFASLFSSGPSAPSAPAAASAAGSSMTKILPIAIGGGLVLALFVLIGKRKSQQKASS